MESGTGVEWVEIGRDVSPQATAPERARRPEYSGEPKISPSELSAVDAKDQTPLLGSWTERIQELSERFRRASPYPHVVIDDFFEPSFAEQLLAEFPEPDERWHRYYNPIEIKYAFDRLDEMPACHRQVFHVLCGSQIVRLMRQITGIADLEHDPHLHGGGLHYHPRGGKLDMHLDYGIHPLSQKERRLNLIVYLNKDWQESWEGNIELWSEHMGECGARVVPVFNRAVLFRTFDESWHGFPAQIRCPEGTGRRSVAVYWVSEPRADIEHRLKARFVARPGDPADERLERLRAIRVNRRITEEDLREIYPDWERDYTLPAGDQAL